MSDSAALYRAQENLRMLATCPTWYDHLDKVEAAMAEQERIYKVRTAAGWEADEGGWYAPHPDNPDEMIPAWEWECETGGPLPEDVK